MDNLSVVEMVVRRLARKLPPTVDLDDIQSAGILGLMDAAQKYDSSRGARFRTYAELRVQGAILDYLRSLSWAPRGMHRRAREIESARSIVEQRISGTATVAELAQELDLTVEQCHEQLMQADTLDFCEVEDLGRELDQVRQSPATSDLGDPLLQLEGKAMLGIVWEAIETLPERHKLILWLYYYEELTMKEVGAVLRVNEARVSQLHSKAIAGLREKVNHRLSPPGVNPE
jgi:RNA polymerase sigma factor for flagellar operon FliA